MPKVTSEKQRRANAENARKSRSRRARTGTGPRTADGKAHVARNALKHGLLATNVDTPHENQADFDPLLTDICAELDLRRRQTIATEGRRRKK